MRKMKRAMLAALTGSIAIFGGCLGGGFFETWWGRVVLDGALDTAWDFVADNDGVFDLFEDGNVAAAQ